MNGEDKDLATIKGAVEMVGPVEKDNGTREPMAIQVRGSEEAELASLAYEMAKQLEAAVDYIRNKAGLNPRRPMPEYANCLPWEKAYELVTIAHGGTAYS